LLIFLHLFYLFVRLLPKFGEIISNERQSANIVFACYVIFCARRANVKSDIF